MDLIQKVEEMREYYENKVKPFIEKENFIAAYKMMRNLKTKYVTPNSEELLRYNSSANFITITDTISKELQNAESVEEVPIKMFEAYLAQICLAVKSENYSEI